MIKVQNVSKQYKKQTVLHDVSLEIKEGTFTAFIGPNGAGKSTLLNMMGRLSSYDTGKIEINHLEITDWDPEELAKKLSILKQTNTMNARITVSELMAFGRFPHKKGKLGLKCHELIQTSLKWLGLKDYEHAYIDTLTGGQLQRAFIGLVLCQDSDYILLDEPLNNLDMKYSVQIMQLLRHLVDHLGKTVVVILHDINYAAAYADHVVAFKEGKIFMDDTVDKLLQKPIIDDLYDTDVEIIQHSNQSFCLYYTKSSESFQKEIMF